MKITGVEFYRFGGKHWNASRNWLVVKVLTDNPKLHGLGDASAMANDTEVMGIIEDWFPRYLVGRDPLVLQRGLRKLPYTVSPLGEARVGLCLSVNAAGRP